MYTISTANTTNYINTTNIIIITSNTSITATTGSTPTRPTTIYYLLLLPQITQEISSTCYSKTHF